MRKEMRYLTAVAVAGLAVAAAQPAAAQVKFGPQVNWGSNGLGVGVGGRVEVSLPTPTVKGLGFNGMFNIYFPGGTSPWEIDANGTYHFSIPGTSIGPYVGGGLAIFHDVTTAAGLNVLGGIDFPALGKVTPFGELRLVLRSDSFFVLTGGLLF